MNELRPLFLPYFDTQHSICEIFIFLRFVVGGPKTLTKLLMISENNFNLGL